MFYGRGFYRHLYLDISHKRLKMDLKNNEIWLTSKQTKKLLGISNTTLWRLKQRFNCANSRVIYYEKSSLLNYLKGA